MQRRKLLVLNQLGENNSNFSEVIFDPSLHLFVSSFSSIFQNLDIPLIQHLPRRYLKSVKKNLSSFQLAFLRF